MYIPMMIVLSLSFNLGINPVELSNSEVAQPSSISSECVLLNTEKNIGVAVISKQKKNSINKEEVIIEKVSDEYIQAQQETEFEVENEESVVDFEKVNDSEVTSQKANVKEEVEIKETTVNNQTQTNQTTETSEPVNSYHDIDVVIPSIHEEEEYVERNNTYHDVDIKVPSIHE